MAKLVWTRARKKSYLLLVPLSMWVGLAIGTFIIEPQSMDEVDASKIYVISKEEGDAKHFEQAFPRDHRPEKAYIMSIPLVNMNRGVIQAIFGLSILSLLLYYYLEAKENSQPTAQAATDGPST